MAKRYDRAYFDRWYRAPGCRINGDGHLGRKVRLALAVADYALGRPARSVLDVGCGEAPWQVALRRLRPGLAYTGVESSEYAVRRFGRRRGIRAGTVGGLEALALADGYDLVVCADVLHYVDDRELQRGIASMAARARGALFLEAFVKGDAIVGDLHGFRRRPVSTYRALLAEHGFLQVAPFCFVPGHCWDDLTGLERPA